MVQAYVLFGIRILSAILLLLFLGLIAWLAYQDLRASTQIAEQRRRSYGYLRVVASTSAALPVGALLPLVPVTTIGRSPGCTIVLNDDYASNEHAMLTFRSNHWWLEDLDSSNGTLLNDILLTEAVVLSAGDIIYIGDTRLKVEPASVAESEMLMKDGDVANDD
ncbi:MAG: FHA domain-containing protein [Candidatus Promineifilaceae bacterium]|nr:FHA domain-containing protein [Candidatus Promineifilaceae bacterium]